ncbi:MAG: PBP1A family penicillin-binding protein [Candidatus Magasanikbacteria bacterium]
MPIQKRSYGYLNNHKKNKNNPNSELKKKIKKIILLSTLFLSVFTILFVTILTAWISKDLPDPNKLTDRKIAQSTKIYDRTGQHLLYEIFADEKRTLIEFEQLPKDLINGVVATEDTKFYEHSGIRPLSIFRSIIAGIFTKQRIGSGASTLTQQLVKNAILTNERSVLRKIKEAVMTIRLEQKYTKEQILKIYFNEIPYGSTNYGVESAAQSYFGKKTSELTLAESATLAGIPKAPSKYINDNEALKQRRDFVLRRMYEEGYITEEQKNQAQAEELKIKKTFHKMEAPHFVEYVHEQLAAKYGETTLDTEGLKVITTLDWDKQQIAEKIMEEESEQILKDAGANNTSLVAIDPKTGQLLAMLGSRNYYDDTIKGQFNVATLGTRQPGSSFKPIIYAAAFEKGYTPDTILFDTLTNFAVSGQPYIPKNYDLKERGPVTIRQALQGSLNIPAVKAMYLVGEKNAETFSKKLGYTTIKDGQAGLSLVLGGGAVKLLEHTNTFATFANKGYKNEIVTILKVEDANGKILEEWKNKKGEKVIEEDTANNISNILSDDAARAYMFGAGGILTLPGRPVAAKTGTTNNYVDSWTMGYTPSLATGVWAGNTNNSPMKAGYGGSMVAAKIWNSFMKQALQNTAVENFPPLPKNTAEKPVLKGSEGGKVTLKIDKATGKLASTSTPEYLIEEKTYIQAHSILHYVKKDDPRGEAPENPSDDPQYLGWEKGIEDWINKNKEANPEWNFSFEEPPTEYDDAHSLELLPSIEIVYPANDGKINTRQLDTDIRVSAPRGIAKVTYQLDGVYVGVVNLHPFNLHYYMEEQDSGEHTLKITAEDDIGNRMEKEIKFILETSEVKATVTFLENYNIIKKENFPKTITLKPIKLNEIKSVSLYYENNGQKNLIETINTFDNLINNQIFISWKSSPQIGKYKLLAETIDNNNEKSISTLEIEIQ